MKHWADNGCSDSFNSEVRYWNEDGRADSDIFMRGLMDGYRREVNRIQRMRKEKEDEVLLKLKVRNSAMSENTI